MRGRSRTKHLPFIFAATVGIFFSMLSESNALASDRYVFILKWLGNPYWQAIEQGIKDTAKKDGIDAVVLSPTNDQQKEEHLNLCQAAISQRPKIGCAAQPGIG